MNLEDIVLSEISQILWTPSYRQALESSEPGERGEVVTSMGGEGVSV